MKIGRYYALFKIVLFGHILNPFWFSREHRRAIRCKVLTREIPQYFKRYLPAVAAVKETKVIKEYL